RLAPAIARLAVIEAVGERRLDLDAVEACAGLSGAYAAIEHAAEDRRHLRHVATMRRQAEARHAHRLQIGQLADQIEVIVRHGLMTFTVRNGLSSRVRSAIPSGSTL